MTDLMNCCKIRAHNDPRLQSDGNNYYYASVGVEVALAVARPIIEAEQRAKDAEDWHAAIIEEGTKVWGEGAVTRLADAVRARFAQPKTDNAHDYTSTACHHGKHDQCRKACKFCSAECLCECHAQPKTATPEERVKIGLSNTESMMYVLLDGRIQWSFANEPRDCNKQHAERYRLGLIAELQAGSGETK